MELSQEYFDQVIKSLATKQDLERFATKDDLLELATKTELRSFTIDFADIKEIVQRIDRRTDEDIKAVIKDVEIVKNRVTKLEQKTA